MSLSLPPNSIPPRLDAAEEPLARLRKELEGAPSAEQEAQLLLQIGERLVAAGDYRGAAQELLAAVNAKSTFVEPLEKLLYVIEKRRSSKNLFKLLERKQRLARSASQSADVRLRQACALLATGQDIGQALEAVRNAVEMEPDSPEAWALLQLVAARLEDEDTKLAAMQQVARLSSSPTRRAHHLLEVAQLKLQVGDAAAAEADLDEVASQQDESEAMAALRAAAYSRLERVGRAEGRIDLIERAIRKLAEAELEPPSPVRATLYKLLTGASTSPAAIGDTLLRGALWQLRDGDLLNATRLLERAQQELGAIPIVQLALARAALADSDAQRMEACATAAEDTGGPAAYLSALRALAAWVRCKEDAGGAANDQLTASLEADPGNLTAHALRLNLACGAGADAYARALEALANTCSGDARRRLCLTAAGVWALGANDAGEAQRTLQHAVEAGHDPRAARSISRFFAALCGDAELARASVDVLATSDEATASELVEALRVHATSASGGGPKALRLARKLQDHPEGAWFAGAYQGFLVPLLTEQSFDPSPLLELASVLPSAETAGLLRSCAAMRWAARGDIAQAIEILEGDAGDGPDVFRAALLATYAQREGALATAAAALAKEAEADHDDDLRFTLGVAAGLLYWRSGDRANAVERFEVARDLDPSSAERLLDWARHASEPDSIDRRRTSLEEQAQHAPDDPRIALERFATELSPGGDESQAALSLDSIDTTAGTAEHLAVELCRSISNESGRDSREDARARIELLRGQASGAMAALRYYEALVENRDDDALEAAAQWCRDDDSAVSAIELLARLRTRGEPARELEGLLPLAERVRGPLRAQVACMAANVAALAGETSEPWVRAQHVSAHLSNLEHSPPGCHPARRAAAVAAAVPHTTLAKGSSAGTTWTITGLNHLAAGDFDAARDAFQLATEGDPKSFAAWDGLRETARLAGDLRVCLDATAQLADLCNTKESQARFFEEAAALCLDEIGDERRGHQYLQKAVERDIERFSSFDRLFRRERDANRTSEILDLIERRLEVTDDAEEIIKLYWERARAHRHDGDMVQAMEALGNVRILEPDHAPALALTGEILLTQERFDEAAQALAELALSRSAPKKQRLLSGLTAADLFDKRVGDAARALRVIADMYDSGLSTMALKERLARAATNAADWTSALKALEDLMVEREHPEGRTEAARLALAIYRDELSRPEDAHRAVECLLSLQPADAEALDLVMTGCFPEVDTDAWLLAGLEALLEELSNDPLDADRMGRLHRLAVRLDRTSLAQTALGCLVALGHGDLDALRELDELAARCSRAPRAVISDEMAEKLLGNVMSQPVARLMQRLATSLAEALGPNLDTLGVGRRNRIKANAGDPVRDELAAWAGAIGIEELEIYGSGSNVGTIDVVATEKPALVIGERIEPPLLPGDLAAAVGRLCALRWGVSIVERRPASEVAAMIGAARSLAGLPSVERHPLQADMERALGRALSRRVKKELPALAADVPSAQEDLAPWANAVRAAMDRIAAVAVGDVSWVLCPETRATVSEDAALRGNADRTAALIRFALTADFAELRTKLGVSPR